MAWAWATRLGVDDGVSCRNCPALCGRNGPALCGRIRGRSDGASSSSVRGSTYDRSARPARALWGRRPTDDVSLAHGATAAGRAPRRSGRALFGLAGKLDDAREEPALRGRPELGAGSSVKPHAAAQASSSARVRDNPMDLADLSKACLDEELPR